MSRAIAIAAVIAVLGGVGWWFVGRPWMDSRGASEAARSFLDAGLRGDQPALLASLTRKAREASGASVKPESLKGGGKTGVYRLSSPTISGDMAVVTATETPGGAMDVVLLRRDEGAWKVYGITAPIAANSPALTIDFEHPEGLFGPMARTTLENAGQAIGNAMKGFIEGVTQAAKQPQP